ncbi:MAG: UpxY family transcription antiterminator [Marinilabiliales bacterium]
MEKWFPLYTRPRHERKAFENLKSFGFEAFLPTYKTLRQWSDRKKKVELPLFPSYCFVKIEEKKYIEPLKANGVVKYVWFNGKPIPVEDKVIESLQRVCKGDYKIEKTYNKFSSGQKIRIKYGQLKGIEGIYVNETNNFKLLIWVDAIGQGVYVHINPEDIEIV